MLGAVIAYLRVDHGLLVGTHSLIAQRGEPKPGTACQARYFDNGHSGQVAFCSAVNFSQYGVTGADALIVG